MSVYVGIHDGHNASAAVVRDGVLSMAVQEERFTRVKNQGDFPVESLAALDCESASALALNGRYMNYGQWRRETILGDYRRSSAFGGRVRQSLKGSPVDRIYQIGKASHRRRSLGTGMAGSPVANAPVVTIDHHEAHAAAAYYTSPWRDERVLVFTCDGSGDRLCATVSVAEHGKVTRIAAVPEEHSLGRFYSLVTYGLGMVPLEHEYKIMGLAPYGDDRSIFAGAFEFTGPLTWRRKLSESQILDGIRARRFDSVAAAAQREVELLLSVWIRNAVCETGICRIACAGGVFMNVKANLAVLEIPEVEAMHVAPSCGDESNAMGAALLLAARDGSAPSSLPPMYFGSDITDAETEECIRAGGLAASYRRNIESFVAQALAEGKIVARVKGAMEFGARALGNRSILARADSLEAAAAINRMIKRRDFWMPFAPTILSERIADYCENPKGHRSPHMMMAFRVRSEKRSTIAAAMHPADFTTRAQELSERDNPDYWKLLEEYRSLTGEAAVLNTSFNVHGEPIVRTANDAVDVFRRSGLEYMALGNFWVEKNPTKTSRARS